MVKETWDIPELVTITTKETEGGTDGTHLDLPFSSGTPKGNLTFS